jgi:hypothetical protein
MSEITDLLAAAAAGDRQAAADLLPLVLRIFCRDVTLSDKKGSSTMGGFCIPLRRFPSRMEMTCTGKIDVTKSDGLRRQTWERKWPT